MVQESLKRLDKGLSRRGFLARAGKVLAAAGLALGAEAVLATPASAACTNCGPSPKCGCCTATVGRCCSGYRYTGYTWLCCQNRSTALYCWDCIRNSTGRRCYCNRGSQLAC